MRDQPRGNELLLALERHLRVGEVGGPLRHGGARRGDLLAAEAAAAASPRTRALMPRAPCRARAFPGSSCRLRPPLVLHLGARPPARITSLEPPILCLGSLSERACRPRTGEELPPRTG